MGTRVNKSEPTEPSNIYDNPGIVDIFQRSHWLGYFEILVGFDVEISLDFSLNLQNIRNTSLK